MSGFISTPDMQQIRSLQAQIDLLVSHISMVEQQVSELRAEIHHLRDWIGSVAPS